MINTATSDKQAGTRSTSNSQNGCGATPVASALGLHLLEGGDQPVNPPKERTPAPPSGSTPGGAPAQSTPAAPAALSAGPTRPLVVPAETRTSTGHHPVLNAPFVLQEELICSQQEIAAAKAAENTKLETEPKVIDSLRASILTVGE